jgi:hypothetical protein
VIRTTSISEPIVAKILFLHGWNSIPGGVKPTHLRQAGHTVFNPALPDDDFAAAVHIAQAEHDRHRPDVIVGSSRGGAVALNLQSSVTPLVLLCPAWKNWGVVKTLKPKAMILHSRKDDVIPFADSLELVANSGLPPQSVIEVGQDHRLADPQSLAVLQWACQWLAAGEDLPWLDDTPPADQPFVLDRRASSQQEASYVCDACSEEIVIPVDLTEGETQTYVEDCPVCCRANTLHIQIDRHGTIQVRAEPEQDPQ